MKIVISAVVNTYTSYGQLFMEVFARLRSRGHDVRVNPILFSEFYGNTRHRVPDVIKRAFLEESERGSPKCDAELVVAPMDWMQLPLTKRSVLFTMWEYTRISSVVAASMAGYNSILTPCQMNVEAFEVAGVTVPIKKTPLGIDPEIYSSLKAPRSNGPLTFGCCGFFAQSGIRKGVEVAIKCFSAAFPFEANVKLKVKLFAEEAIPHCSDPRIEFSNEYMPTHKLVDWYRSLDVFVMASRGEGWGLMPHQAMAVGVPVIGSMFGGLAEFLTPECSYIAYSKLSPARSGHHGHEVVMDEASLIEQMRRCYYDRNEVRIKGELSAARAAEFTWDRTVDYVEEALKSALPTVNVVIPSINRSEVRKSKGFSSPVKDDLLDSLSVLSGQIDRSLLTVSESDLPVISTEREATIDEVSKIATVIRSPSCGMYADALRSIRAAGNIASRYVILIEDDVIVCDGFIEKATRWLSDHGWPKAATFLNWNGVENGGHVDPDVFWGTQCIALDRDLIGVLPDAALPPPNELQDRTWALSLGDAGVKFMVCSPSLATHTGNSKSTRVNDKYHYE